MAAALFSFRNEVDEYRREQGVAPFVLENGTSATGSLDRLLTRQLERSITLTGGNAQGKWLRVYVRSPDWGMSIPTPEESMMSRFGVRLIALLGMDLPFFRNIAPGPLTPRIRIYGTRFDPGLMTTVDDLLGELPAYREHGDPDSGMLHRFLAMPAAGDGLSYGSYLFNVQTQSWPDAVQIGRPWIGNAVQIEHGVDADWTWGVQGAGRVAVSRGGQAYANPAPALRTLSATLRGSGLDARLAFGKGVSVPPTGIRRSSDWLSDAATHLGTTGSCILLPRTSEAYWVQQTGIYGRLNGQPIQIQHLSGDFYRADFGMIEER